MLRGILVKETHGATLRFAPAVVIERGQIDQMLVALRDVLGELRSSTAR